MVIQRAADIVKPDAWVRDRWRVIGASRLDDEDLRAGRGQFRGQHRTGRPSSHHDEVVATLDFFTRCVDHCWVSRCQKAEFHDGKDLRQRPHSGLK